MVGCLLTFGMWLTLAALSGVARADDSPVYDVSQQVETAMSDGQKGTSDGVEDDEPLDEPAAPDTMVVDTHETAGEQQVTSASEEPNDSATPTAPLPIPDPVLTLEPQPEPAPVTASTMTTAAAITPTGTGVVSTTGTSTDSPSGTVAAIDAPGRTASSAEVPTTSLANATSPPSTVATTSCGTTPTPVTKATSITATADSTRGTTSAPDPKAFDAAACAAPKTDTSGAPAAVTPCLSNGCAPADLLVAVPAATARCAATPVVVLSTLGLVHEEHASHSIAGAHVVADVGPHPSVRPRPATTPPQTQAGGSAAPSTVAPPATPLSSPVGPPQPLPTVPLPAPATMTGGTCGVPGSGRADGARGGDSWDAITPGQPTPDASALTLKPTLTARAHQVSGADEPAVRPD